MEVKPQNTKYGKKSEFDFKKKKGLKWQKFAEIEHYFGDKQHRLWEASCGICVSVLGGWRILESYLWRTSSSSGGHRSASRKIQNQLWASVVFKPVGLFHHPGQTTRRNRLFTLFFFFLKKEGGCFQRNPQVHKAENWELILCVSGLKCANQAWVPAAEMNPFRRHMTKKTLKTEEVWHA